ncbi:hypothetical protein PDO_5150 [Rhizobium sp. PDO1-076]|uniref:hypothetical protein n=1 Tax=Rhizobium sp. PDO1-076 TaxID=1125979 RepID=UPI00024E342C|nr:hypothetical protein [Rhizobium sp. PDO1-076]EHS51540.1 hypothetical protein PDO_5150 [Rhizobium sp. PDO1-076]
MSLRPIPFKNAGMAPRSNETQIDEGSSGPSKPKSILKKSSAFLPVAPETVSRSPPRANNGNNELDISKNRNFRLGAFVKLLILQGVNFTNSWFSWCPFGKKKQEDVRRLSSNNSNRRKFIVDFSKITRTRPFDNKKPCVEYGERSYGWVEFGQKTPQRRLGIIEQDAADKEDEEEVARLNKNRIASGSENYVYITSADIADQEDKNRYARTAQRGSLRLDMCEFIEDNSDDVTNNGSMTAAEQEFAAKEDAVVKKNYWLAIRNGESCEQETSRIGPHIRKFIQLQKEQGELSPDFKHFSNETYYQLTSLEKTVEAMKEAYSKDVVITDVIENGFYDKISKCKKDIIKHEVFILKYVSLKIK